MGGEQVEARAGRTVPPRLGDDLAEPPVRIGPAQPVHRRERKSLYLSIDATETHVQRVCLQPCGGAADTDPRPAPRGVDVVRECDGEACSVPARRLDAEVRAQPLERRIERVEG